MMGKISQILKQLTTAGEKCVYCGREIPQGIIMCENCAAEEVSLYSQDNRMGGILHVFRYEGIIRNIVHRLKYDDQPRLAIFMAQKMADFLENDDLCADVITFVPIHKERLRARGFDQAEMIAMHLSTLINLPCEKLLKRVRNTKAHFDLDAKERAKNVSEAFMPEENVSIMNRRIVIVDDVYTTGATMGECVRCLLKSGAKEVLPYTFSKEK